MKIIDVRLKPLFSKFKTPYIWAMGRELGQTTILVEIETDTGIIGFGETAPTMLISEPIIAHLKTMKTKLLGQSVFQISDLMRQIYSHNFGHFSVSHAHPRVANLVFAGLEMALWDAFGKSVDLPVHALLGGKIHDFVSFMGFVQGETTKEIATKQEVEIVPQIVSLPRIGGYIDFVVEGTDPLISQVISPIT